MMMAIIFAILVTTNIVLGVALYAMGLRKSMYKRSARRLLARIKKLIVCGNTIKTSAQKIRTLCSELPSNSIEDSDLVPRIMAICEDELQAAEQIIHEITGDINCWF